MGLAAKRVSQGNPSQTEPGNTGKNLLSPAHESAAIHLRSLIEGLYLFLSLTIVTITEFWRWREWDFDDAMIIYRIVKNLLAGLGWVYNSGEAHNPSTSVLNTALIALGSVASVSIPTVAHILGALCMGCTGLFVTLIFRQRFGTLLASGVGMGSIYLLAESSIWGLEVALFSALLMGFVWAELRAKSPWLVLSLLTLTRPDGAVLLALRWTKAALFDRRSALHGLLVALCILSPWCIFSLVKFGQLFPDTLGNKIWQGQSGYWGQGWVYGKALGKHLLLDGRAAPWLLIGGCVGWPWLLRGSFRAPFLYLLLFVTFQQVTYVLLNVPGYHWYFTYLDLALLLGSAHVAGTLLSLLRIQRSGMIGFAIVIVCLLFVASTQSGVRKLDPRNEAYKNVAAELSKRAQANDRLGALEVGTFGFYSNTQILDLVGLASKNPELISGKHTDFFYEKPPRFLVLHEPVWHFERAIVDDVRFQLLYDEGSSISDPFFPMRLYTLRDRERPISKAEIIDHLNSNFPAFTVLGSDILNSATQSGEALCALDLVNGQLAAMKNLELPATLLTVRGWAVDTLATTVPDGSKIVLIGDSGLPSFSLALTRSDRSDVAVHLGRPDLSRAGYTAQGTLFSVPPGHYRLGVLQPRQKGTILCSFGLDLAVRPSLWGASR